MKIESHREALEEHKNTIFKWALEVYGLEKSQRIVGLHVSRASTELLSIYLHKHNLIDEGFQLNHRWFKSPKVGERLPEFPNKEQITKKMSELENLSESLTYGTEKPVEETKAAIKLFKEIENLIGE